MTERYALAMDIGGTHVKAGLIGLDGTLTGPRRLETPAQSPPDCVVEQMVALVHEICGLNGLAVADLSGIGVSIAAFITADGMVVATAHLSRQWIGYDLTAPLRQVFDTEL